MATLPIRLRDIDVTPARSQAITVTGADGVVLRQVQVNGRLVAGGNPAGGRMRVAIRDGQEDLLRDRARPARLLRRDAERWGGRWRCLVSPAAARCLLTMRAATSSSLPAYRPSFLNLRSICLYSRSRLALAPVGMACSC